MRMAEEVAPEPPSGEPIDTTPQPEPDAEVEIPPPPLPPSAGDE